MVSRSSVARWGAYALCAGIAFAGGVWWAQSHAGARMNEDLRVSWDAPLVQEVNQILQSQFKGEKPAEKKIFYGALRGMVSALGDPNTVFFDPAETKDFSAELSGSFAGIGAELGVRDRLPVVIAPLDGSPAQKAGIKSGDIIISVNGQDMTTLPLDEVVRNIRGEKGTRVTLVVVRENGKTVEISVIRDEIKLKNVETEERAIPGGTDKVLVVRIAHFNEETFDLVARAVMRVKAEYPRGVVMDLRGNPGGYLQSAIDVASLWIANGAIVSEKTNSETHVFGPTQPAILSGTPTVVLIDGGSASASEIVAGALQDTNMARIIGKQSFGKGSVQDYRLLPDGSSVKVTVATWYTPSGTSIHEKGITPDTDIERGSPPADNQLKAALEYLAAYGT